MIRYRVTFISNVNKKQNKCVSDNIPVILSQQKETESHSKKNDLEKKLEVSEAETVTARNDLKLALKRIEDLQTAINGELDSESDSYNR